MLGSLFLIKLQAFRFATLLKSDPNAYVFPRTWQNSEEHLQTIPSVSSWHIQLKGSSNKSEFYTSKTYSFPFQQALKKISSPKYSGTEFKCLIIFVGKGFKGKIWLLQNQFLFGAGQTCSHTFGNEFCNCSFHTDPWKKSELFVWETKCFNMVLYVCFTCFHCNKISFLQILEEYS